MRVLVVDDEPVFRRAARALLERRGHVVVGEAGSASEAEAAVGQLSPDALLLDVRLGDASGFDVAYALTRAYPKLAVLLVSADVEEASCHERAAASGARGIRLKSELAGVDLDAFWSS